MWGASFKAEVLTGSAVRDIASAREAVIHLLARGPSCVVLTLGARGVVFSRHGTEGRDSITHLPAEPVASVDTTVSPGLRSHTYDSLLPHRELEMRLWGPWPTTWPATPA